MNILFIPHSPNIKIINRVYEFAKTSNSYFLSWNIDNSSFKTKISSQITSLLQKVKLEDNILTMPLLFKPDNLARKLNSKLLNYIIKKFDIDMVVNANALLFDIEKISIPVVYDLVDDHLEINSDIGLNEKRIKKVKNDISNSMGVICVSTELEKKVNKFNTNTITIENGLYIDRFEKAKSLKKELNLVNKKVFGYIGGVDRWTGIDKACENFLKIKDDSNAMIVVGDSDKEFFANLKIKYKNEIIFTGLINPSEVANYFKTIDVGLIPFILNDFTNNAYPIKAIEYALADATVISTELIVLKSKQFPFIEFCNIENFSEAMKNHIAKDFDFDFSNLSWTKQTKKLINFIEKLEAGNNV